jgi:hypothetical protein
MPPLNGSIIVADARGLMEPVTDFSVNSHRVATETSGPVLTLLSRRLGRQIEVPGAILHGQFSGPAGLLFLTTENVPYEEALHVLLFNQMLEQTDHLEVSNKLTPGALSDLCLNSSGTISFSFFGGDLWQLTVLEAPVRALFSHPPGVHWPDSSPISKHYLRLTRVS